MQDNSFIQQANNLKKKGKIQEAMELFQQAYHSEGNEGIEKSLYEIEQKVAKKYHPNLYNSVMQMKADDHILKKNDFMGSLKKEYPVWSGKIQVASLWKQNKKEKALQLLHQMKYYLPEERVYLCEDFLNKKQYLLAFHHAQRCLDYLPPELENLLRKGLSTLLTRESLESSFLDNLPNYYFIENKGLSWIDLSLNEYEFQKLLMLNIYQLFRFEQWDKGKKFVKKYEKRLSGLPLMNNIKFKFNWFSIWKEKKALNSEQSNYLSKEIENLYVEDSQIKVQLNKILNNGRCKEEQHPSLLLDYNPVAIFSLPYHFSRNDIIKGVAKALSRKKISPRALLILQRFMMNEEYYSLVRYLFCWPQLGSICVH